MIIIAVFYLLINALDPKVANCYRIFMLPANVNSHISYIARMGRGLSKIGHEVVMPVPSNAKIPLELANPNFTIIPYEVNGEEPFFNRKESSDKYLDYALAENKLFEFLELGRWFCNESFEAMNSDCESLLENRDVMNRLVNLTTFDFAILDFPVSECFYAMVKILDVPFGVMSIPLLPWNVGVPRFPSFSPPYYIDLTDKMSFSERLFTAVADIVTYTGMAAISNPSNIPDYLPYRSNNYYNILEALKNASLLFYLEDVAVNYPRAYMPDVVSVGDVSSGIPASALPISIDSFLADSKAVIVSFGSYFQHLRNDLVDKFCEAFSKLPNLKIIWKMKNESLCGPKMDNLLIMKWMPQNDLLADERVKILITHGGFNSLIESIYHAKPVIVFPIAADQPSQAKITTERGFGKSIDLRYWTPDDLASNITEIMNNPQYELNAKHYSAILKSRRNTPSQRVSEAIEQVLTFGADHLRSHSKDLHWSQFMMFDVSLVLFTLTLVISYSLWYILKKIARLICRIVFTKVKND